MGSKLPILSLMICLLGAPPLLSADQTGNPKKTPPAPGQGAEPATFSRHVQPFLTRYCTGCHGGAKPKARLSLDQFQEETALSNNRRLWQAIVQKVRDREMPPPERKQKPTAAEIDRVTTWVETQLKTTVSHQSDPGRVTLRRLNRAEYNNTIRDLVGVNFRPADDFPTDDVGYGFDNIGDVLSMPPILMEKYLTAAEKIVALAWQQPETRKRILIRQPTEKTKQECARQILEAFATRAYRRPVTTNEVNRLLKLVEMAEKNGDNFETGIQLAIKAILVSPHFLFHVEVDPPNNPYAIHPINQYELASRLSYFLWSSMPDEALFFQARNGHLRLGDKAENLEAQVRRMLADPRSKALVENFAGQWLQLRNLKTASPDTGTFPAFDESLRKAMLQETELFFEAIVKEDRSILDFLDADFTFVNERLARHYGIPGVKGEQFRRVSVAGTQRGGILTQASILTVTSNSTRTSPVKRGKWILENILGTPPPPPPPDAGELSEDKNVVLSGSLRKRMEQHRANPTCASCHQRMDPLGFGFENFDAIGAWRDRDGQFPIDPSGILPSGQSFKGPRELKGVLKGKQDAFCRCLTEKLLTYALGRGLEEADQPVVERIASSVARNNYKFSNLVLEIVKSDPFQKRRGKRGKP